ncbi:MAG TPA: PilZ domain-containing protein [Deltaproteobacteria bacterium]|nr:PilZ domain-containing protein [Deltaproteobacteria bacterium]HQB39058.1 PilZ domain-containing protein [Deltaproteobacteria bacterium]
MENSPVGSPEPHIRIVEDVSESLIVRDLLRLINAEPQTSLELLNYYQEVPVSAPLTILYAFGDTLFCRTSDSQTRVVQDVKSTLIRAKDLRHPVYARALYHQETNELELSGFAYVEVLPERRASIRVRMKGLFQVVIEAGKNRFSGRLRVLSLHGCAVEISDRQLLENFTFFYLNMEMPFSTFKGKNTARVMARLLRVDQLERCAQCIFMFEHDNTTEDQVGRLLMQRQTEIIRELK